MAEDTIEGGAANARQEAIIDNLPPLEALAGVEREVMEYDVVVVGGGPAGLSAAIRLKQRAEKDGREITGSHALLAVGSIPQTAELGLAEVGVDLTPSGHIVVDRVSRTSVRGVYAAGDCTGVLPLASVAAMQGRIAMSQRIPAHKLNSIFV